MEWRFAVLVLVVCLRVKEYYCHPLLLPDPAPPPHSRIQFTWGMETVLAFGKVFQKHVSTLIFNC